MILLIDDVFVKANSPIDNNVADKIITPYIKLATDKWILPLLGTTLYNDLVAKLTTDITLATQADYKDLMDTYIQKTLLWYFLAESVLFLSFKFTNKNVVQKTSDNSQATSTSDLLKLKAEFAENAEMYADRTRRHLLANPDKFPKYLQLDGNSIETMRPENMPYETGMCLDMPYDKKRISFEQMYQGKNGICNPNDL